MLSAILILSFLIFFHELGHYLMARLVGVRVEVFSIGFGKKLICKKFGDTHWCISAIPLGGYVQMKGQDDFDPLKKSLDKDSYSNKTPFQRILILLGGPGFNFLLAFLIYFFIALYGVKTFAPVVGDVVKDSPASKVLKKGDYILEINGYKIKSWNDIPKYVNRFDNLILIIKRENKIVNVSIKPKIEIVKNEFNEDIKRKMIGIMPANQFITIHYGVVDAFNYAYDKLVYASTLIFKSIEKMIIGSIGLNNLSCPIGIVDITAKVSNYGIIPLLMLTALLSVNLGVLNLLPIPTLDGRHIVFNMYEAITKKEVSLDVMYKLTIAGWILLGSLMIIGIYNDINRLIGG